MQTPRQSDPTWRRIARSDSAKAIILVVVTLASYLPAIHGGFIWDDRDLVTQNPLIRMEDGLRRFWFSKEPPDYYPLPSTTWWIEWRFWGMNPSGYHATNVGLHIGSALLLWRILRRLKVPGRWRGAPV